MITRSVINTFDQTHISKVVAEQVPQSTECLGQEDWNLQVRIQLICSCQEEQLAVEVHKKNVNDTSDTLDRHEEFVASDSDTMETRQVFSVGNGLS